MTLAGKHVLITAGPTHEPIDPVRVIANRSSGRQGFAIAAVADWRVEPSPTKLKKDAGPPQLTFVRTRDILAELSAHVKRPRLVVGFAAETDSVVDNAVSKRSAKRADWIVANDVSGDVMGGHRNRVHLVTADGVEDWPEDSKNEVARHLIARIAKELE